MTIPSWTHFTFATLATTAALLHGEARKYEIHPAEGAQLELTVDKTGLYNGNKHVFTFEQYYGTLILDADAPERSIVSLSIDARSITCHDTWVSMKDLRKITEEATKNMLAVDRFPNVTFQSSSTKKLGNDRYEVLGNLTIRGISKPVAVQITGVSSDQTTAQVQGEAIVRLTDYNLKPPTAVLGAIGTKNEMTLRFHVRSNRDN